MRNIDDSKQESELVKEYIKADEERIKANDRFDRAKNDVREFMRDRKAEEIIDDTHVITLTEYYNYDKSRLKPMLEIIPTEDLISSGAYKPAETKLVEQPESWDIRHLNKFRKRGREVGELIDKTKVPKSFSLKVSQRRK